jgi:hypothetical protein
VGKYEHQVVKGGVGHNLPQEAPAAFAQAIMDVDRYSHTSHNPETSMSTTAISSQDATGDARVGQIDMKLEVTTIPVSDVDRAKEFYGGLGWRLAADFSNGGDRVVQFTPPGSQCSIGFGV